MQKKRQPFPTLKRVFLMPFLCRGRKRGTLKPRSPNMQMYADLKKKNKEEEEEEKVHNTSVSLCSQILPAPVPTPAQLFVAFVSHCHIQSKIGILYKSLSVFIDKNA